MDLKPVTDADKDKYNQVVTHVMQSFEWGELRKSLGLPLLRYGLYQNGKLKRAFQLTLHKIPLTNQYVGYLPKGPIPDKELSDALTEIGKKHNCAFIKIEPDVYESTPYEVHPNFLPSPKPLFTKHNFIIDLTLSEEELLKNMQSKTRYNIKVAQKKGVKVSLENNDKSFKDYLKLYFETTARQGYHGHNEDYHKKVWQILKKDNLATLLLGKYKKTTLVAWMLLIFKDTLYYPYGGSSDKYKEVMASNLVAWEAIKYGKKLGLKKFDMWGALGPNPNPKDPFFGFHRFKKGYGGELVTYIGTYDLVFNETLYWAFTYIDKFTSLKVFLLKLISKK